MSAASPLAVAAAPACVIGVTGGKGGVGKSNVAVNLGVALARAQRRVLLLDADLGLANVDVLLGLRPRQTLEDVLAMRASLDDVLLDGPLGLGIVPASSGVARMACLGAREHAGLIGAFSALESRIDTLIVDTAAGISDTVVRFLSAVQHVLVVVCDEPTSITDGYALIKVLNQEHGIERVHVLANMVRGAQEGERLFATLQKVTARFLDVALYYAGAIPFDDSVRRAVRRQRAVCEAYPASPASRAFARLGRDVSTWQAPRHANGRLQFFAERLLRTGQAA
jgi:flagellar biosynthesis protein FlhG